MSKKLTICLLVFITCAAALCVGIYKNEKYESAFDHTRVGDTEAQVLARFGSPDFREPANQFYTRYANSACKSPCKSRLWWEDAIFPGGFAAWSVELDSSGKVIEMGRWVSP